MTASLIPDTIPHLVATALFKPGQMRSTPLTSNSLAIFEPTADPIGARCLVLSKEGPRVRLVLGEPAPGFYLTDSGSLHPRHAVRGIVRVIIQAQGEVTCPNKN